MPGYKVRLFADLDIDAIADYIGERNRTAGRKFIVACRREFEFLGQYPLVGSKRTATPRRLDGLRSWPVKRYRKYLIFYLPLPQGVEIVRVLHGARDVDRILAEM